MSFEEVGRAFVEFYYQAFDSDRSQARAASRIKHISHSINHFSIITAAAAADVRSGLNDDVRGHGRAGARDDRAEVLGTFALTSKFILNQAQSLAFATVAHSVTTIDCQPSEAGMVVVFVVGQLKVCWQSIPLNVFCMQNSRCDATQTDEDPPHGFSQTFTLKPAGGSYYVLNDIFRLILHSA